LLSFTVFSILVENMLVTPIKLLFAEDNKTDQLLFERFVKKEKLPYRYQIAGTLQEAKFLLKQDAFDIIISDYNLGDGTALDLLKIARDTPVIVVTGAGDEQTAVQAMKLGAYDYLIKNLQSNHLLTLSFTVENALNRKRNEMELQKAHDELEKRVKERTIELQNAYQELHKEMEQRKSLEEKYYQSQKMEAVGRLAGGIAHDFNNLLTIIQGYCQLLMVEFEENNPHYEKINQIQLAGNRAESLIRQLLAFSRKQVIQPRVLNLNHVITEIQQMIRRLIGEDIELKTTLSPELAAVKMDHGQMEQVIMNIVVNARDAMPTGGKLIITTQNEHITGNHPQIPMGDYAMISFTDTGTGMDSDIISHIFEPFFTTKEQGLGTGLGLATVYGIVKQCDGHITARSEPKKGTTITIYLPQVFIADKDANEIGVTLTDIRGTETILVVEDEIQLCKMIEETLTSFGYSVITAAGGREAISLYTKHKSEINCILTDVIMPKMDGRLFIDSVKPLHPKTKVLFMSGYTDDEVLRHGILDFKTQFIQKPFSPLVLVRKIREVLDT
jgi:signal transduction histidine kinase